MKWLILLLGIGSNATASVLIKVAVSSSNKFTSLAAPSSALASWPLCLGLAMYGAAFLLYAAALARFPLNVVHPVLTSGAMALVALLSIVVFKEPFYWTTALGIFLVIVGVLLISVRVV